MNTSKAVYVRFEVATAAIVKSYFLGIQGKVKQESRMNTFKLISYVVYSSTLKMESYISLTFWFISDGLHGAMSHKTELFNTVWRSHATPQLQITG
jgi:hypothetical protein